MKLRDVFEAWLQSSWLVGFAVACFLIVTLGLAVAAGVWVFMLPARMLGRKR